MNATNGSWELAGSDQSSEASRLAPTAWQLTVFATVLGAGSRKAAAHALGISRRAVYWQLHKLYERLEAESILDAAARLGWLRIPIDVEAHYASERDPT